MIDQNEELRNEELGNEELGNVELGNVELGNEELGNEELGLAKNKLRLTEFKNSTPAIVPMRVSTAPIRYTSIAFRSFFIPSFSISRPFFYIFLPLLQDQHTVSLSCTASIA
jgi:hypothetical protein